jgi:hypothetical protein
VTDYLPLTNSLAGNAVIVLFFLLSKYLLTSRISNNFFLSVVAGPVVICLTILSMQRESIIFSRKYYRRQLLKLKKNQ